MSTYLVEAHKEGQSGWFYLEADNDDEATLAAIPRILTEAIESPTLWGKGRIELKQDDRVIRVMEEK